MTDTPDPCRWFESFPLVFNDIYHFSLGTAGLPFLAFVVSGAITFTGYMLYQKYHMEPRLAANPDTPVEARLELGLFAAIFVPISQLMFGWGARESVHWIVPVIGAALYLPGIFILFQCIMIYLSIGWYKYATAILAGNDLFRSSIASVFPLFGHAFFVRLGLGGGSSLLAGLSILMIPLLYVSLTPLIFQLQHADARSRICTAPHSLRRAASCPLQVDRLICASLDLVAQYHRAFIKIRRTLPHRSLKCCQPRLPLPALNVPQTTIPHF